MARLSYLIGTTLLSCALCGCSPYLGDYQYVPHPALAEVPPSPPDKASPLSVFASVIGVYAGDARQGIPQSVEVRFRMENNGPHSVSFDPASLRLDTGDLQSFQPPIVRPPTPVTLAPQQTMILDAFFPFPPGHSYDNTDLRGLQLLWEEQIDGRPVRQAVSFRRTYPYRYYYSADPYWGYPWFFGGGVVVVGGGGHHWR